VKFIFPDKDISIVGELNENLITVQKLKESLPIIVSCKNIRTILQRW